MLNISPGYLPAVAATLAGAIVMRKTRAGGGGEGNIPHIVVVGGGIMASWSTLLLTRLARLDMVKVTMVDAGHPIRGSWGDTRALHVAIEDDTKIKMNKINVTEYIKLQRESTDSPLLVQKVGRIFCGPAKTMQNMLQLIRNNGIAAHFVDAKFLQNPDNTSVTETFKGIELRDPDFGFANWRTVYTPVGYILKADNILENLREQIREVAAQCPHRVELCENSAVSRIERREKTVVVTDQFSGQQREIHFDRLLLTAGPWTNSLLSYEVTTPYLSQLPLVVSNEQTQDFEVSGADYDGMPLVSYSDGGYIKTGGEYYFIVGPTSDTVLQGERKVKVGYHRQGDLMDNDEFPLPALSPQQRNNLVHTMSHIRKDIKTGQTAQSFDTDPFIMKKARTMVRDRLEFLDEDKVSLVMRCLYQNTPDKEFIVGYHKDDISQDIVIACGFNGGGFQMGPMIARLCLKLLIRKDLSEEEIVKLISVEAEDTNTDFSIDDIDLAQLLNTMERQFSPSRPGLTQFKWKES